MVRFCDRTPDAAENKQFSERSGIIQKASFISDRIPRRTHGGDCTLNDKTRAIRSHAVALTVASLWALSSHNADESWPIMLFTVTQLAIFLGLLVSSGCLGLVSSGYLGLFLCLLTSSVFWLAELSVRVQFVCLIDSRML